MDFHIEFNIELSGIQPDLLDEVADRLKKLSAGHTDLIGAAVGLEKIADGDTPYLYRGRIGLFSKIGNRLLKGFICKHF